jgi:hypothetical protein
MNLGRYKFEIREERKMIDVTTSGIMEMTERSTFREYVPGPIECLLTIGGVTVRIPKEEFDQIYAIALSICVHEQQLENMLDIITARENIQVIKEVPR